MEIILHIFLLAVGFLMLTKGADWFVDGAAGIAEKFGIPQLVVGLTIVAMGTSAPEAAVSITSATGGNAGITIGNIVGSNIINILVILGLTGVITAVAIQKSTLQIEIPYMLFITVVLLVMGLHENSINLWEGIILWVLFIAYLSYLFIMAKKGKSEEEPQEQRSIWMLLLLGVVGACLVIFGADFTVDSAVAIAEFVHLDDRIIGLTIVALGTSLPELVTSVTAARKGNADIAIGNIVGSNVFNILFVVGTSALIVPIQFKANFMVDSLISLGAGILLWISLFRKKKLTRPWGIVMLVAYAAYLTYLLMV